MRIGENLREWGLHMKNTLIVLHELQNYWDSLPPDKKPSIRRLSELSGLSYSTTARYINGTTKEGLPDKVRALARALGRDDLMGDVTAPAPTNNAEAWWITEVQRVMREEYTEQIERERKLRKETEDRFADLIKTLEAEKVELKNELLKALRKKKRYEKIITGMVVFLIFYLLVFDLPHPKYGITNWFIRIINMIFGA